MDMKQNKPSISLYRYPHPSVLGQWIYVGQTNNIIRRDGLHRYGKSSFGRRFIKLFPDTLLPKLEVFDGPFLDKQEADWAEIESMFKHHTWCGYPNGMNLTLPGSQNYKDMGSIGGRRMSRKDRVRIARLGGLVGGRKGGQATNATTEGRKGNGGRLGGKNQPHQIHVKNGITTGYAHKKNGTGIFNRTLEQGIANARKGGLISGNKNADKPGYMTSLLCKRWNINRNRPCICGHHKNVKSPGIPDVL